MSYWPIHTLGDLTVDFVHAPDLPRKLAAEPMERTALILVGKALAAADFIESSLYSTEYQRRFRSG